LCKAKRKPSATRGEALMSRKTLVPSTATMFFEGSG